MKVNGMDHFSIHAGDLDATVDFYRFMLGLEVGDRPPLGFPGAWLYCGGQAVLHVMAMGKLPAPEHRSGLIDHMAFAAEGLEDALDRLAARGIRYDLIRRPQTGHWQLFFRDPDGAMVELDFDPAEPGPDEN